MTTRTEPWPAGTPCWTDLATTDVAAAQAFYGAVVPWAFGPPSEQFGGYVMADADGRSAAGIGPAMGGAPVAWTMYFASDDADATAAAITDAGGVVHMGPDAIADLGRIVIAQDPTGATFGVWEAGSHNGSQLVGESGALAWEDLRSTDPDAAREFYAAVFGFEFTPLEMAGPGYTTFAAAGTDRPLGGMGPMMGADGSSHWLVYFAVDDVDASAAAVADGGGTVVAPPFDTPFGRMAPITDPQGAALWIFSGGPA